MVLQSTIDVSEEQIHAIARIDENRTTLYITIHNTAS